MFIPLGTDRPRRGFPVVTTTLLVLNVLVFLTQGISSLQRFESPGSGEPDALVRQFWLVWMPSEPWRFLTYAFLHGGFMHLLGNMLFLWVFGPNVEDRLGRFGFLGLYLIGGVVAGVAHIAIADAPVIGASGAVSALTGAFLVLFPRTNVRVLLLFVLISVFNIPALWFIGFAIAKDLFFQGFGGPGDNVARGAHLGGYAFGGAVAMLLLATRVLEREPWDMFGLLRQARRRQEIRQAGLSIEDQRRRLSKDSDASRGKVVDDAPPWSEAISEARSRVATAIREQRWGDASAQWLSLRRTADQLPGAVEKDSSNALGKASPTKDGARRTTKGKDPSKDAKDASSSLRVDPSLLSRRLMLDLGNGLTGAGNYATAAEVYRVFVREMPRDPEAANVSLMLALLLTRYLNRREEARALLERTVGDLRDEDHRLLAQDLLRELGSAASSSPA
ncbi:MAG: rhomboid family intramembrane serine protease [Planctomycetota bacterium]|nr:rhomboid family intramembrane serine protease [Planctomycetota bacterium]